MWAVFAQFEGRVLIGAIIMPASNHAELAACYDYTVPAGEGRYSKPDGSGAIAAITTFNHYSKAEDFAKLLRRIGKIATEVQGGQICGC